MAKAGRLTAAFAGLLIAASVSGCGFQPLYGGPGYQALPGMEIDAPGDRIGYLVQNSLRDHLGDGRSAFRVELLPEYREAGLGVSAAGRASRFGGTMQVSYRLLGPDGFEHVGRVSEQVFYDAPSDPFALIAARASAEERSAERVAERLARDFAIVLQRVEAGLEP